MQKTILALDMGGTSVKAAIYKGSKVKEETKWEHNYRDCGLEKAKEDLVSKIKAFYNGKLDAIGLAVAGLIATDNSLYRSTVLTSFTGFNIPDFLKQELGAQVITIDNDADCGAISEKSYHPTSFFYVVVGSGIGSCYVDIDGNLPYLTRLDPKHEFEEKDNPTPNDLGLKVKLHISDIWKRTDKYKIKKEAVNQAVGFEGKNLDSHYIRVGSIASSIGLKKIIDMLLFEEDKEKWFSRNIQLAKKEYPSPNFADVEDEKKVAKILSYFAKHSDSYSVKAFELFGYFLGVGIERAAISIRMKQNLKEVPLVVLSGPIMESYNYFSSSIVDGTKYLLPTLKFDFELSNDLHDSNVRGAYFRAAKALEQKTF